jgi:spectinomycin phosphotransferase
MPEKSWIEFGETLKTFHQVAWPSNIAREIRHEAFSPQWRKRLTSHLTLIDEHKFEDPIGMELVAFVKSKRDETFELVTRAEQLSSILVSAPPDFILCHGDIHGWNLFFDLNGSLYIVDWDTLIFAPKERDLMFIGASLGDSGYTSEEESAMFYQGYGHTEINNIAITYYRYERIIEDLAILTKQIFSLDKDWRFRKQALEVLKSNYLPNNTIEAANQSY